jgi:hypothetical protein
MISIVKYSNKMKSEKSKKRERAIRQNKENRAIRKYTNTHRP